MDVLTKKFYAFIAATENTRPFLSKSSMRPTVIGDLLTPAFDEKERAILIAYMQNNPRSFRHAVKYGHLLEHLTDCPDHARTVLLVDKYDIPNDPVGSAKHLYLCPFDIDVRFTGRRNHPIVDAGATKQIHAYFKYTAPKFPKIGERVVATREEFEARLAIATTRFDGKPDLVLRDIIANATPQNGYCIAGGFIAKMLDLRLDPSIPGSDVDVNVYAADEQRRMSIIRDLYKRLYVPDETFIVSRLAVATVYRHRARPIQVISTDRTSANDITIPYDCANVMANYSAERGVRVALPFVRAMQTGVTHFYTNPAGTRLHKALILGFDICSNSGIRPRDYNSDEIRIVRRLLTHLDIDARNGTPSVFAAIIATEGYNATVRSSVDPDNLAGVGAYTISKNKYENTIDTALAHADWDLSAIPDLLNTRVELSAGTAGFEVRTRVFVRTAAQVGRQTLGWILTIDEESMTRLRSILEKVQAALPGRHVHFGDGLAHRQVYARIFKVRNTSRAMFTRCELFVDKVGSVVILLVFA